MFMPTGTLANHLAVRSLTRGSGRAIVQAESHLFNDSGDCVQTLSGITLIPLVPGRATFTADDVTAVLDRTGSGRVATPVSVISLETPVRRRFGETFDEAEMERIASLARREGIRLHLDGARIFLQSAYSGRSVAEYADPFDTVYVSLYKYFNAASGAILAGPRAAARRDVSSAADVWCWSARRVAVRLCRSTLRAWFRRSLWTGGRGLRGGGRASFWTRGVRGRADFVRDEPLLAPTIPSRPHRLSETGAGARRRARSAEVGRSRFPGRRQRNVEPQDVIRAGRHLSVGGCPQLASCRYHSPPDSRAGHPARL